MIFSERLKLLRIQLEDSQLKVATAIGISDRAYRNLESGVSVPNMNTLIALAEYFNVSIDYLTGRTSNPKLNKKND